ncbi:hypothetical protein CALCODRAFT_482386 [Calocera cornea HHB12733]|uniref:PH domain-containing protein n=1 Tax=Calocera cornea HHB12733 TaxID=1353952 RepID=A0A165GTN8_9BASI|nr:hypothetical protein CALCODRAFT_482386 [Calocera cornea HHB12733]
MPRLRTRTLSHVRSLDLSSRHKDDRDKDRPPVPPLPPVQAQGPAAQPPVSSPPPLAKAPQPTPATPPPKVNGTMPNGNALRPESALAGPSTPARGAQAPYMHGPHGAPGSMLTVEDAVLQSGWLLKKGKKKLQGFARRHFTLTTHGVLSYRLSPTQPVRGSRALRNVSVAASGKLRQINIDGGDSSGERSAEDEIWHLKCLSSEEWTMWMTAIRRFIVDPEVRSLRSLAQQSAAHSPMASIRSSPNAVRASASLAMLASKLAYGESRTTRMSTLLGAMEHTIGEMDRLVSAAAEEEAVMPSPSPRRTASFGLRGKKEGREPHLPGGHGVNGKEKEKEGIFGIFHRRASHKDQISPVHSASDIPTLSSRTTSSPTPSYSPSHHSTAHPIAPTLASLSASLHTLRDQHAQLLAIVNEVPPSRAHSRPGTVHEHSADGTVEEHSLGLVDSVSGHAPAPFISVDDPSGGQRRLSIVTTASGATEEAEWFDADDWNGEEIELDNVELEDSESEGDAATEAVEELEVAEKLERDDDEESDDAESMRSAEAGGVVRYAQPVLEEGRRTTLPTTVSGEEVSLWAVLRKNVGKDLSTVSFPVTFNEPLSLLQKLAEDMEYCSEVLVRAVAASDPVQRMCYVAAFAVSTYASTHYRAARKPFNPMLGETFEDIRPSSRFIAEKVTHHPPVMASYAEGDGWTYWATSGGKNKFWGRSLEIIPTGTTHIKIGENHYTWQKPSSFMRNLVAGQKYVEHVGQMTISDSHSQLTCVLDFKDSGFWGSSRNAVSGVVRSADGSILASLEGAWHESFSRQLDSGDTLSVLWRANAMPAQAEQYYGFTTFAMQLNEILPSQRPFLPPTDSRLRPDQRALEEGRVDEAEAEKLRLEQAQRRRRAERDDMGKSWEPKWFTRVPGPSGLGEEWEFKGGEESYWEVRKTGRWDDPGLWA